VIPTDPKHDNADPAPDEDALVGVVVDLDTELASHDQDILLDPASLNDPPKAPSP
jgi:hypothetical protein